MFGGFGVLCQGLCGVAQGWDCLECFSVLGCLGWFRVEHWACLMRFKGLGFGAKGYSYFSINTIVSIRYILLFFFFFAIFPMIFCHAGHYDTWSMLK